MIWPYISFMEKLEKKVKNNTLKNNLILAGEKVLIGLSGGPDSTALTLILKKLSSTMKFSIGAVYLDHEIRPEDVPDEILFCRSLCDQLNISFYLINKNIPELAKKWGKSLEETAREVRRHELSELAEREKFDKIALGHHQDDIVETILFRLFRGTGPSGLDPIKPISGNIIRPLYNITRNEIEEYLGIKKTIAMLDKSNLESGYSRNYIRNKILPVIENHFGEKARGSIVNLSRIISAENDYLDQIALSKLTNIYCHTPGGKIIVDLTKLGSYDVWLRRRIYKLVLEKLTGNPGKGSFEETNRIDDIIQEKINSTNLPEDIRITRDRNYLFFVKGKVSIKRTEIKLKGETSIEEINGRIKSREIRIEKAITAYQKKGYRIHIDFDKISPPLYVRNIKRGDSFSPLGMMGTKKIGDYLTDCKIPKLVRDEIAVIEDKLGIVWLVGQQISDRIKIENSTRRILEIEFTGISRGGSAQIRSAVFAGCNK